MLNNQGNIRLYLTFCSSLNHWLSMSVILTFALIPPSITPAAFSNQTLYLCKTVHNTCLITLSYAFSKSRNIKWHVSKRNKNWTAFFPSIKMHYISQIIIIVMISNMIISTTVDFKHTLNKSLNYYISKPYPYFNMCVPRSAALTIFNILIAFLTSFSWILKVKGIFSILLFSFPNKFLKDLF